MWHPLSSRTYVATYFKVTGKRSQNRISWRFPPINFSISKIAFLLLYQPKKPISKFKIEKEILEKYTKIASAISPYPAQRLPSRIELFKFLKRQKIGVRKVYHVLKQLLKIQSLDDQKWHSRLWVPPALPSPPTIQRTFPVAPPQPRLSATFLLRSYSVSLRNFYVPLM